MTDSTEKKATITLDAANNDPKFPAYQLSINVGTEHSGHGYRLMGPKYVGRSRNLRTVDLSERDADSIRSILDEAFPPVPSAPAAQVTDESAFVLSYLKPKSHRVYPNNGTPLPTSEKAAMESIRVLGKAGHGGRTALEFARVLHSRIGEDVTHEASGFSFRVEPAERSS